MKNYIKVLFFLAAFLFLVSVCALTASAEDGTEQEETNDRYKTEIIFNYIDWAPAYNGGYSSFTIYSDKPFYMFYMHGEDGAVYPYYFCGSSEEFDISLALSGNYNSFALKNCSISGTTVMSDGSQRIERLVSSATVYNGKVRVTVTATCPIFNSAESLQSYLETGDESGWTNKPVDNDNEGIYDESLGHIEGLSIKGLDYEECHGSVDFFANCFSLSWLIPDYDRSKYMEFFEFKFDMQYSYITSTMTKRAYGSKFLDFTSSGKKLFISVTEGTHIFCAHDFYELLNLDVKATSFYIQDVRKIYVRLARVNRASGDISYGDWAVYDVDFRGGTFSNERIIGDNSIYPGNVEIGDSGIIEDEPTQIIPAPDSSDNGFSFAGIDLTDVVNIGKYFIGLVESLINMIGNFPALFNRIFLFLPVEIRTMIYMFFVILVISGLLKIFV